ncbi:MAG: hypothetical protein QXW97_02875 [Candidatus Pacearchaeota archaeon]
MKILFICKHNLFRSKIAEAYFNKINKNPNIRVDSAGVIIGNHLNKYQKKVINIQRKIARTFGLKLKKRLKGLSTQLLSNQDLIIVTANDIPRMIFNNPSYVKKVIIWKIPDIEYLNEKNIREIINLIIQKVDLLYNKLNK